ncbi:hypothetical protein ACFLYA_00585 [Candidatus Dependentiae bacterium]
MIMLKDWIYAGIEVFLVYMFIYVVLYSLKHDVNLFFITFILLVIYYIATRVLPVLRIAEAWKQLSKKVGI